MDAIILQMEKIARSPRFASSPRLLRFLRFCVEESRQRRFGNLKETVIGVQVFDRQPGYDPKLDPIVRVNARRLREKLAAYYETGTAHQLVIRIPKGGYVASFEEAAKAKTLAPSPWRLWVPFARIAAALARGAGRILPHGSWP